MEKISIVFPFFNEEKRINTILKNILNFLKKKFLFTQIIFVNDRSYDKSTDIVKNFIKINKNYNLKLIHNKHNLGKGFSIREGIKQAKGQYINI